MAHINRKIHFFRISISELRQGSSSLHPHTDPYGVFDYISKLQFIDDDPLSRYLYLPSGDVNLIELDSTSTALEIKGRFAVSRRTSLPELEDQGVLKGLNIPANAGLAEITHFVYYPTAGVIGLEFNFYGPRATSLKDYVVEKSRTFSNPAAHIDITPILNLDVDRQVRSIGDEVSLVQIEVAKNSIGITEQLDTSLKNAFEAAASVSEAETVEVILRKKKYSKSGFGFPFVKQKLIDFLTQQSNRDQIHRFKLVGQDTTTEKNKAFDLLEDKMISTKSVITIDDKRRAVESTSMYNAINEAYHELRDNFARVE
ncbi:hypothetical protein [Paenibacillus sp. Cedars]|uniref:hypothetical protein n=1 Tax=Paenibacillus sp. Cedars TaxID=1980674 RepID=UPI00116437B8|nr:hypothetical protein [Paenibacillus sp. Cedars]AWP26361.1 hypothetical protein B9D94_06925 [Paenibacillus sp. Cedars]